MIISRLFLIRDKNSKQKAYMNYTLKEGAKLEFPESQTAYFVDLDQSSPDKESVLEERALNKSSSSLNFKSNSSSFNANLQHEKPKLSKIYENKKNNLAIDTENRLRKFNDIRFGNKNRYNSKVFKSCSEVNFQSIRSQSSESEFSVKTATARKSNLGYKKPTFKKKNSVPSGISESSFKFTFKPSKSIQKVIHSSLSRQSVDRNNEKLSQCLMNTQKLNDCKQILNKLQSIYELVKCAINGDTHAYNTLISSAKSLWNEFRHILKTINSIKVVYNENDYSKKTKVTGMYTQVNIMKYLLAMILYYTNLIESEQFSINQNLRNLYYNVYQNYAIFLEYVVCNNQSLTENKSSCFDSARSSIESCATDKYSKDEISQFHSKLVKNKVIKSSLSKDNIEVTLRRK